MAKRSRRVPRYLRAEVDARNGPHFPEGSIPADLDQQVPINSVCPPLFYQDTPYRCIDCGRDEVWTAAQQKWWYEVAKGSIYSRAKRCKACRIARRLAGRGTPPKSHRDRQLEASGGSPGEDAGPIGGNPSS